MTKNPFINAITASLYITAVATFMNNGNKLFGSARSVVIPIAILSLFTLSAAVMGYVFLYQPLMMFLDGHKKNAVNLFLQTVTVFAGITILLFILLFFRVFK